MSKTVTIYTCQSFFASNSKMEISKDMSIEQIANKAIEEADYVYGFKKGRYFYFINPESEAYVRPNVKGTRVIDIRNDWATYPFDEKYDKIINI